MTFDIVENMKAMAFRKNFIDKYIDTEKEYFRLYIDSPSRFEDGEYYDGYLWDCLKYNSNWEKSCSLETALLYVQNKTNVLVMFDLFSNKKVFNHRILSEKYPKDVIIKISGALLSKQIKYEWEADWNAENLWLPEDMYIFDESMDWSVIFTHETTNDEDNNSRVCFIL